MRDFERHYDPNRLGVMCWCQREILYVPAQVIRDGRTGSCGHAQCDDIGANYQKGPRP